MSDMENLITVGENDTAQVEPGENIVEVTTETGEFLDSRRTIFSLPGLPKLVDIPLVPVLKDGQLAVVLTWSQGQKTMGSYTEM